MNFAGTYTYLMDTPSGKRETKVVIRKNARAYEGELISSHGGCEPLENCFLTYDGQRGFVQSEYISMS